MPRFLGVLWLCAVSAMFFTHAQAAPALAPAVAAPAIPHNWTGFYLGGHFGGALGNIESSVPRDQFGGNGVLPLTSSTAPGYLGGGQLGVDWQTGWLVIGVEAALSSVGIEGSKRCFGGLLICKADSSWLATVTAHAGATVNENMLVYALAGHARREMEFSATGTVLGLPFSAAGNDKRDGWVVGVGGRYAFSKNCIGVIEYNYADFSTDVVTLALTPPFGPLTEMKVNVDDHIHMIKAGVNYQF